MQRILGVRARVLDDTGAATPTPLFLAYVTSLGISGAVALRGGARTESVIDFLLLAAIVTGAVLLLFALVMIWAARAGQRGAVLAQTRPGAIVLRAGRARGARRAVRALRAETRFVPAGVTLLADHTGFEVWCGSPEHPVRMGRVAWDAVDDIRVSRVTRLGRSIAGFVLVVREAGEDAPVELPFLVLGSGLGGLGIASADRLEHIVCALGALRAESLGADGASREALGLSVAPLEQQR